MAEIRETRKRDREHSLPHPFALCSIRHHSPPLCDERPDAKLGSMMFASDNWAGASERVLAEIAAAGRAGSLAAYGDDEMTRRVERRLSEVFEREVAVALVPTGTAANALAVATFCPPWGAVVAFEEGHLAIDECGAAEAFSGARVLRLPARRGKLEASDLARRLDEMPQGLHHGTLSLLSLTEPNEFGLIYTPGEIAAAAAVAEARGLAVHMDGARFANAVARLGCAPADLTWRAGVDVMSLGGTKGGCLMAEAVILFDPAKREELMMRRKRAGHLVSKHRLIAAQFLAWLDGGHWLELSGHANAMADRLAEGIGRSGAARLAWARQANEVFAVMATETAERLKAAGATFYEWSVAALEVADRPGEGEALFRFVTSFATTAEEVDGFLALLG